MADPQYKTPQQVADDIAPEGSGLSPLARLLGNLDHRPTKMLPFPGTDTTVGMWALTDEEQRRAEEAAFKFVTVVCKLPIEHAKKIGIYDREQRVQLLNSCLRHPNVPQMPFAADGERGANEVRRLTPDVQDVLFGEYVRWLDERSPLRKLDPIGLDAHIDALVECLGKGQPADALLSVYDSGSLRDILVRMAARLATGMKGGSSDSSAQNDGTSRSTGPSAGGLGRKEDSNDSSRTPPGAADDPFGDNGDLGFEDPVRPPVG